MTNGSVSITTIDTMRRLRTLGALQPGDRLAFDRETDAPRIDRPALWRPLRRRLTSQNAHMAATYAEDVAVCTRALVRRLTCLGRLTDLARLNEAIHGALVGLVILDQEYTAKGRQLPQLQVAIAMLRELVGGNGGALE